MDASYGHADAEAILEDLCDKDQGLAAVEERPGTGGQPRRLFLSSKQTLPLWFRSMRASVTNKDRDDAIRDAVDALQKKQNETGPFAVTRLLRAHGIDSVLEALSHPFTTADKDVHLDVPKTRLVVLDHGLFSLGNGEESETLDAIRYVSGVAANGLAVQWAASLVFAVANTQARKVVRATAADLVGWQRVAAIDQVRSEADLMSKVQAEIRSHETDLRKKILQTYQHLVYLAPGDDEGAKVLKMVRLDQATESALNGSTVWSKLREEYRAVGRGEFTGKALLANLDARDYGIPLDEVRSRFWQTVRKPLLWSGDSDLKNALYEAVRSGSIRIVGAKDGDDREVTAAGDIQFLASLHLAAPQPVVAPPAGPSNQPGGAVGGGGAGVTDERTKQVPEPDAQLSLSLNTSLTDPNKRQAVWKTLNNIAIAVDDGVASHIQISVKVTAPKSWADELKELGGEAGMASDVREL